MISVEVVKEEGKKTFVKNHMIILSPKTQQLESVGEASREASLATLQPPWSCPPMA